MGYTIFWRTEKPLTKEEVEKCVSEIKNLIKKHKDIVRIDFNDKNCNNNYNINFNGIGDDAHETFVFYSQFNRNPAELIMESMDKSDMDKSDIISINGNLKSNFCKTARKPYDKIVKKALKIIQKVTDNKLFIRCDDGYLYYKDKRIKEKENA